MTDIQLVVGDWGIEIDAGDDFVAYRLNGSPLPCGHCLLYYWAGAQGGYGPLLYEKN